MSDRPFTVAVTGLEGRDNPYPGVAIARALRAARGRSLRIVGLAYDPLLTGAFRRDLFDHVVLTALPADPPATQLRRLFEIHDDLGLDAVIPALDSELPLFARHADALRARGILSLLPPLAAVQARMKPRLQDLCARSGTACPRTAIVTDPHTLLADPSWPFPYFLKGSLADARPVRDAGEMLAVFGRLARRWGYPILAQEPVNGDEYDVCAVARPGGEPAAMAAMRKIGLSRAGKAIAAVFVDDPGAFDVAAALMRHLRWAGPLEVELVRDHSSGRFHLIEINARFPAWVAATAGPGPNLPDVLLRLLRNEELPATTTTPAGAAFVRISRTTLSDISLAGDLLATGRLVHHDAAVVPRG